MTDGATVHWSAAVHARLRRLRLERGMVGNEALEQALSELARTSDRNVGIEVVRHEHKDGRRWNGKGRKG